MAVPISSDSFPPWIELPTDLTSNILKKLNWMELLQSAQKVCTTWWNVCKDPAMWSVIDMRYPEDVDDEPSHFIEIFFRLALCRSHGGLTDINMHGSVGTDEWLHYISKITSQLRRLRIAYCSDMYIYTEGLTQLVYNNPLLEEVHLSFLESSITKRDVVTIGFSCPMLKSFTLDYRTNYGFSNDQDNACLLAISRTMPNLRHLRVVGNGMSNEGLQAVLDKCLHLESLDLRGCYNLELDGGLLKMLSRRVKVLRLPRDPIDEYDFEQKRVQAYIFDNDYFEHNDASDDDDSERHDIFSDIRGYYGKPRFDPEY